MFLEAFFLSNSLAHSGSNPGVTNMFLFFFLCHFPCQFQKLYKYAKFDQTIFGGRSRVMSFFTKRPRPVKMMLIAYQSLDNVIIK